MFDFDFLREVFLPGKGRVERVPNRLKKGFLKRSTLRGDRSRGENKQGDREKARRRRQIERGILKVAK